MPPTPTGERVVAGRVLLDCTGQATLVGRHLGTRRAFDEESLRKVAYFEHFDGVERPPGEATGHPTIIMCAEGWFWLIGLSETRTSVGFVTRPSFAKEVGVPADRLLRWAVARCPVVRHRMRGAAGPATNDVLSDFSYTCRPHAGPGYLLVGDAGSFLDPIFSTGVTLAMIGGQQAALRTLDVLHGRATPRAARRAYCRFVEGSTAVFWRLIRNYYRHSFRELFMNGAGPLQVHRAVISVLAGNVFPRPPWSLRWRLRLFEAFVLLQQYLPLVPRRPAFSLLSESPGRGRRGPARGGVVTPGRPHPPAAAAAVPALATAGAIAPATRTSAPPPPPTAGPTARRSPTATWPMASPRCPPCCGATCRPGRRCCCRATTGWNTPSLSWRSSPPAAPSSPSRPKPPTRNCPAPPPNPGAAGVIGDDRAVALLARVVAPGAAHRTSLPRGAKEPPTPGPSDPDLFRLQVKSLSPHLLLQSSGTTGLPKIVRRPGPSLDAEARAVAESVGFGPADRVLMTVPLTHSYGLEHGLLAPVWGGSCVVLCRGLDPAVVLPELTNGGITIFPGVPSTFEVLAGAGQRAAPARRCRPCAAPTRPAARCRAPSSTPSPPASACPSRNSTARRKSAPSPSTRPTTCPEKAATSTPPASASPCATSRSASSAPTSASRPLPPGEEGQVAIRAASMFGGYLDGPADLLDGHFPTGDLGRLDARGRLFLTGRLKLLIDVGGLKVNPLEVEAVLQQHPAVGACVVVPIRQSQTVYRLKAVVTPRDPAAPVPVEELRALARSRLAAYKVPRALRGPRTPCPARPPAKSCGTW